MYFEKEIGQGRAFMELERKADGSFGIKRRGFVTRYKGGFVQPQMQQATESPLIHDGSQSVLSTATDFRNSTLTGTTLNGPNGSGQFLAVTISTGRTITLLTSTMPNLSTVNSNTFYGICQNKPRPGDAVDVGIFGISKCVSGSSAITGGQALQCSSTTSGVLTPFVAGNGRPVGIAIENALTVGAVFSALIMSGGMAFTGST
jgi:hypothetical protein